MNLYSFAVLSLGLAMMLDSCERYDAENVNLSVTASSTTAKVGETVIFSVSGSEDGVVVYTGDSGHEYEKSSDYLLSNVSEDQLKDSIYLTPDTLIKKYMLNFADKTEINPQQIEYPDMELVDDDSIPGKKTLRVRLYPNDWGKILKIYPRVGVGTNKYFSMNIRFITNDIYKKVGSSWVTGSTKTNFRIVTEVFGKTADGTVVNTFNQGSPNSLWYANVITPSTKYVTHQIDLTKWIANWETGNNLKLQTIDCITMKFLGDNNAAYDGYVYISNITLGEDGYHPFATGKYIYETDGTGKMSYNYSFSKPGTYNVTFITTGTSYKNYREDGYQTHRDISGDDYKYARKSVTIPITVTE